MTLRFLTCAKLTTLTCRAAVPVRDFWLCAVQSLFLTDQVIPKWGSFDYGLTYACAIPEQTNRICFKASWAACVANLPVPLAQVLGSQVVCQW